MGYELSLRPRRGLDEDRFVSYFNHRFGYRFPEGEPQIAAYASPKTDVYFHFGWSEPNGDEPTGLLTFSLNLFRPHVFAIEAERELRAVVAECDLTVHDPQVVGSSWTEYDGNAFVNNWSRANRRAHAHILGAPEPPVLLHLPRETLERIWRWNYDIEHTHKENGGTYTASLVAFARRGIEVTTMATIDVRWSSLVPRVDIVRLIRGEQATAYVGWDDVARELHLDERGMIDEPWAYWAVVSLEAERLSRFLRGKHQPSPVEPGIK